MKAKDLFLEEVSHRRHSEQENQEATKRGPHRRISVSVLRNGRRQEAQTKDSGLEEDGEATWWAFHSTLRACS